MERKKIIVYFAIMAAAVTIIVIFLCVTIVELKPSVPRATGCSLDINKDLTFRHPLILKPDENEFFLPNSAKGLSLTNGQKLRLACPGKGNHFGVRTGVKEMEVECIGTKEFEATNGTTGRWQFNELFCKDYPDASARRTGNKCSDKYTEIEIGFELPDGQFVRTILNCFDETNRDSLYSMYNLTAKINVIQISVPRPSDFEESSFYPGLKPRPSSLYTRRTERTGIGRILGSDDLAAQYISLKNDFFLSRGHLTAKSDFVYGSQQRATFFYVNVAPQWQIFNGKNWNFLEISVRKFAAKRQLDLVVYTGVHGTATLPDVNNEQKNLSLYVDLNGNKAITVPAIYWKVLHDPVNKKGIAFVGTNNPYDMDAPKKTVCTDICDKVDWLSWEPKNITLGYSYCCDVDELRKVVDFMPQFDVHDLLV